MSEPSQSSPGAGSLWVRWVVASAVGVLLAAGGFLAVYAVLGEPGDVLFPSADGRRRRRDRSVPAARPSAPPRGCRWMGAGDRCRARRRDRAGRRHRTREQRAGDRHGRGSRVGGGCRSHRRDAAVARAARRRAGARWWVPASIGGWALAASVAVAADYYVDGLGIAAFTLVAAAVTGVALAALLRFRLGAGSLTGELRAGVTTEHAETPSQAE